MFDPAARKERTQGVEEFLDADVLAGIAVVERRIGHAAIVMYGGNRIEVRRNHMRELHAEACGFGVYDGRVKPFVSARLHLANSRSVLRSSHPQTSRSPGSISSITSLASNTERYQSRSCT